MNETRIYPVGIKADTAKTNFERAVQAGIPASQYANHTDENLTDPAMLWGYRQKGIGTWRQLKSGDYLLFYTGEKEYRYAARIRDKFHNPELGAAVFDTLDEIFEYIVYLGGIYNISISSRELHQEFAGYKIDHPVRSQSFNDATYEAIIQRYNSVEQYIEAHRTDIDGSAESVATAAEINRRTAASDVERPKRISTRITRIVRNTSIVEELKELYNHKCQVCGIKRYQGHAEPYAEGHHIHPLGHSPSGPDERSNILILCPNHHADFDYGMVRIDPDSLTINHPYDDSADNKKLTLHKNHTLKTEHLRYHNDYIAVSNI